MREQSKKMFSILELLIVITIMTILAIMGFYVTKGVKDGARTTQTESTINSCKVNIENLYNFILNQSRSNSIEVYQHPMFTKIWPSNKVWTFKDKDESDMGINVNGLMNLINIGNLGVENKSITVAELKYPDNSISKTLIDGWGFPILLMRNEMPWFVRRMAPGDNVIDKVYRDRTKASMGLYAKYMFKTNDPGKNLYGWNDAGFNHVDSKGVNEPSYEVAPLGTDSYRKLGALMYGKVAVPYNNNDFDFFSAGKDGKIGNLIKSDNKQDRWTEVVNKKGSVRWEPVTVSSVTDPDTDNIVTFNRYIVE